MATYSEAFNRMGETVLDTTKKIAEINVRTGERLLEQQAELTNQWVNAITRNVDLTAKAMGYHELFAGQAQILQEYNQQLLTNWRRSAEIVGEASRSAAEAMEQAGRSARQETRRQTQQQQG
jgi:Phasin protein